MELSLLARTLAPSLYLQVGEETKGSAVAVNVARGVFDVKRLHKTREYNRQTHYSTGQAR